jgi:hypothetical protein
LPTSLGILSFQAINFSSKVSVLTNISILFRKVKFASVGSKIVTLNFFNVALSTRSFLVSLISNVDSVSFSKLLDSIFKSSRFMPPNAGNIKV